MNVRQTLCITVPPQTGKWDVLEKILIEHYDIIEKAEPVIPNLVIVEIRNHDKELSLFINELRKNLFEFRHTKKRTYTKKEILSAEYAWAIISEPWDSENKYAEDFGTKYTEAKCDVCSNGKIQISELLIPSQKASHYDICSLKTEIIVGSHVQSIFLNSDFSGYVLKSVRNNRSGEHTNLKQLVVTHTLPEMSKRTGAILNRCPQCDSLLIDYIFDEIVFEKSNMENAADFNLTFEQFSMMNKKLAPQGLLIVSQKVISAFTENNVKKISFEPIVLR